MMMYYGGVGDMEIKPFIHMQVSASVCKICADFLSFNVVNTNINLPKIDPKYET